MISTPARLALLMTVFVVACSANAERRRPSIHPPAADPMLAVLEDNCGSCHGDGLQAPRLGPNLLVNRELAVKVALMLSANRMPPAPAILPPAVKMQLVTWSCEVARAAPNCAESVRASASTSDLVRGPLYYAKEVKALVPRPDQPEDPLKLLEPLYRLTRVYRLDPTYGAVIMLIAATRCRALDGGGVDAECVKTLLSPDRLRLSPASTAIGPD